MFYPLAQLGLARALVLAGDTPGAREAYHAFLSRWKEADADLPVMVAANQENARVH